MRTPKLPFSLLAALSFGACMTNDATPVEEVTADLELENGGFDTADEAAEFGATTLFAEAQIEPASDVADEMQADITAMDVVGAEAHDMALVWGRLPPDPTATDGRDWSGTLELSRGGMLIRRRIGFELATDRTLPRTRRDLIEFRSVTRPFADGLVLRIVDDRPGDAEPIRLTYRSIDGTRVHTIDLRDLATGPIVRDDGDGNRMVAAGRRRNDSCAHGTMRGRWHALAPNAGVYLGVVANAAGEPIGHVRGIFGERRNGNSVMFGKFIDRDGRFTGVIQGNYDAATDSFEARWLDRQGDHGVLKGLFFEGATLRAGGYVARWAETSCGQ
ncbi:MAG: hypothetical protein H0V17_10025 [Deltaproteobacteria bacterium]|nr:hypothetical protein [Deltaproteobacteria bacterium]